MGCFRCSRRPLETQVDVQARRIYFEIHQDLGGRGDSCFLNMIVTQLIMQVEVHVWTIWTSDLAAGSD